MQDIVDKYAQWVLNNQRILASILILVTLFFGFQMGSLKVNPSLFLLDKSDEGRVQMAEARKVFETTGEQIFVGVVTEQKSIFNRQSLETIAQLTKNLSDLSLVNESDFERLKALRVDEKSRRLIDKILANEINNKDKGSLRDLAEHFIKNHPDRDKDTYYLEDLTVRASPIVKIRSLSNIENITLEDDSLEVDDLMSVVPSTQEQINKLEDLAYENKLYLHSLISEDRLGTTIQIELSIDEEDSYNLQKMYKLVLLELSKVDSADHFHIGGSATYLAAITDIVEQDNNKFFPFVVLVIAFLLYVSFRRWQAVWIPLVIAIVTLVWTMGTVSLLGYRLNIITNMIPVFLISIAVADAIHFLSTYYVAAEDNNRIKAVSKSLDHLFVPMLLTSITTFIGFVALTSSNLSFIREFGLFVAIGVVYAFLLTISLLPLILPKLKLKSESVQISNNNVLLRLVDRLGSFVNRISAIRPVLIVVVVSVMCGVSGFLVTKITVDNENLASFSSSTRVRQDNDKLNQHFGGTIPVSIWFESEQKDIFKTPEMLHVVRKVQAKIHNHPEIGYTLSYVDYLDRIHQVMAADGSETLPVNPSQELISQYFLLYEFGQGNDIQDVVDYLYENSRIVALSYTDKGSVWQDIVQEVTEYATPLLPPGVSLKIVGMGELQASNIPEIVNSQIYSFIISIALILVVLMIIFRSIVLGFIGVTPLVLTMIFLGGLMYLIGIPLDIGTSMISGICFGVGIDYTIYFLSVFKRSFLECGEWDDALNVAMKKVCRPILINSITLSLGFSMLTFSNYAAIQNLGLLIVISMTLCAILALLLLPTLIRIIKPSVLVRQSELSVSIGA